MAELTAEQVEQFRAGLRDECDDDGTREAFDSLCDLALAALGGGWQPIETAPFDGTRVLLWCPNMDGPKQVIARFFETGDNFPWAADDGSTINVVEPKAWQPIPAGPSAPSGS